MSPTPLVHGVGMLPRARASALLNKLSIYTIFVLPLFLTACQQEAETNARMTGKDETPAGVADFDTQMRQDREKRDFDEKQAEAARKAQEAKEAADREFQNKKLGVEKELKLEELKVRSKEADNSADFRGGEQKGNVEARKYEADARVTQSQIQAEAQRDAATGQMWGQLFQAGAGLAGTVGGAAMQASGARDAAEAAAGAQKSAVDANRDVGMANARARVDEAKLRYGGEKALQGFARDYQRHQAAIREIEKRESNLNSYAGALKQVSTSGNVTLSDGPAKERLIDFARRNNLQVSTQPTADGRERITFSNSEAARAAIEGQSTGLLGFGPSEGGELASIQNDLNKLNERKGGLTVRAQELEALSAGAEGVTENLSPDSLVEDLPGGDSPRGATGSGSTGGAGRPSNFRAPGLSPAWLAASQYTTPPNGILDSSAYKTARATVGTAPNQYQRAIVAVTDDRGQALDLERKPAGSDFTLGQQIATRKNAIVAVGNDKFATPLTGADLAAHQVELNERRQQQVGDSTAGALIASNPLSQAILNNKVATIKTKDDLEKALATEAQIDKLVATTPGMNRETAALQIFKSKWDKGETTYATCTSYADCAAADLRNKFANTGYQIVRSNEFFEKDGGNNVLPHGALMILDPKGNLVGVVDTSPNPPDKVDPAVAAFFKEQGIRGFVSAEDASPESMPERPAQAPGAPAAAAAPSGRANLRDVNPNDIKKFSTLPMSLPNGEMYRVPEFFSKQSMPIHEATTEFKTVKTEAGEQQVLVAKQPVQRALELNKLPAGQARVLVAGRQTLVGGELVSSELTDNDVNSLSSMGFGTLRRDQDDGSVLLVPALNQGQMDRVVGESVGAAILDDQNLRGITSKVGPMSLAEQEAFGSMVRMELENNPKLGLATATYRVARDWKGPLSCGPASVACAVGLSERMGDQYSFEILDNQRVLPDGTVKLNHSVKVTDTNTGESFVFSPENIPANVSAVDWARANAAAAFTSSRPGERVDGKPAVSYDPEAMGEGDKNLRGGAPSAADQNLRVPQPGDADGPLPEKPAASAAAGQSPSGEWKGIPYAAPEGGAGDDSLENMLVVGAQASAGPGGASAAAGVGVLANPNSGAPTPSQVQDANVDAGNSAPAATATAATATSSGAGASTASASAASASGGAVGAPGAMAAAAASASVEVNNIGLPTFPTLAPPPLLAAPSPASGNPSDPMPLTDINDLLSRTRQMEKAEREAKFACVGGYDNDECAGFKDYVNKLDEIRAEGESLKSLRADVEEIRKKNNRTQAEEKKLNDYREKVASLNTKIEELNELRSSVSIVGTNQASIQNTQTMLEDAQMSVRMLLDALGEQNYNPTVANQELGILGNHVSTLRNQDIITDGSGLYAQNSNHGPGTQGDGPSSDLRGGGSGNAAAFR